MRLTRPLSLKDLAIGELRRRIIEGQIELGDALSENALAADLGISKTPVREALLQLKTDGLVEIQPQRGTFVFSLTAKEVSAISELRTILELAAIEAAMTRHCGEMLDGLRAVVKEMGVAYAAGDMASYSRLDGAFHEIVVRSAGNPFLESAYALISFRVQALRSRLTHLAQLTDGSFDDHCAMVPLIEAGRVEEVKAMLRSHIDNTTRGYLMVLREHGSAIR